MAYFKNCYVSRLDLDQLVTTMTATEMIKIFCAESNPGASHDEKTNQGKPPYLCVAIMKHFVWILSALISFHFRAISPLSKEKL